MNLRELVTDWTETVAEAFDDLEARPAGSAEPIYRVSQKVMVSRDRDFFVYHLADDQLGKGASFGNARTWAETKGNGDMLGLFSIEAGAQVLGGLSVTYHLPFSSLAPQGVGIDESAAHRRHEFARVWQATTGRIHLHPAYQQRQFVIGDGLHVLETFFVPRRGMDDPAVAHMVVHLRNQTLHPLAITIVGSLSLGGRSTREMKARYDTRRGALVAWNASNENWVRVFGTGAVPDGYWATTDEEGAYSPGRDLPNDANEVGDLTGAVQYHHLIFPGQSHKLRFTVAFSPHGEASALNVYDEALRAKDALKDTVAHYASILNRATLEAPEATITHGIQWAKACLLRPLGSYPVGEGVTNDPGHSTHLVGRDTAWYAHGSDFVIPEASCGMLRVLANRQRLDGLIPEYIDGNTGAVEDHAFNINDNTPLFVMAVAHHINATGHRRCLDDLYEPALRAVRLILAQRNEQGLVRCTADGVGAKGICGWRNVLMNEQITGVVTELNSECVAALRSMAELATRHGSTDDSERFMAEADRLRAVMNEHLINRENGLYVRNIDLQGRVFTQATVDLVFPMICQVADEVTRQLIRVRLDEPDFMTEAGIRALPEENPRYNPSSESGCLGGIWPGASWWYAMSCAKTQPEVVARSLARSYRQYVADPKTFNTVPGQFSEWSDGQTFVNRGMRLSPWEAPRFLWAAIEGLAGINLRSDGILLDPQLPADWHWLRLARLPYHGELISFFLIRHARHGYQVYTPNTLAGDLEQHRYDRELYDGVEALSTGLSLAAFERSNELLVCLGNGISEPRLGPFLTHRALRAHTRYRVLRLTPADTDWQELGSLKGTDLQRLTVQVEGLS